ncbi:hypothetical protein [uncultured Croceitalea sp.]|uniref:hypothetical protein n=1 Tax=uncultured Croceitalea sp. TaxID=1798908 RepID=UPI0033063549
MKKLLITVLLIVAYTEVHAQNPLSQHVQTEFGIGITTPFLHSGTELERAADLRSDGLSYFANDQGNRENVGDYGSLIGWSMAIAYYHPVKKIKGLMLGAAVRNSLTGSVPDVGSEEGYFFNFLSLGLAAKYYPFTNTNMFFKLDGGLSPVWTKNRFLNSQGQQEFFHQFGIGGNITGAVGYSLTPFKNKTKTLDLQLLYQYNTTRVEVNGIGDDQWNYSALTLMTVINF